MLKAEPRNVNRHTGGLENLCAVRVVTPTVNRHTGGLEKSNAIAIVLGVVNRHTGGLENQQISLLA